MTWARFDDNFLDSPEAMRAGEDATNLHIRATIWCSKHLTDGAIPREALRAITGKRKAELLAARLVDVGVWEATLEGWVIPRFTATNPSRVEVEARRSDLSEKRAAAGRIGGKHSAAARSTHGNAEATGQANSEANGKQSASPPRSKTQAPSRPVPSLNREGDRSKSPGGDSNDTPEPPKDVAKTTAAKPPRGGRSATVQQGALSLPGEPPPPAAKPRRAFAPIDACNAIARASCGRFASVTEKNVSKEHAIAIGAQIDRFPTIEEWQTVGEWLAAGGERMRQTFGPRWAASAGLQEAMAEAASWVERGRPALLDARGFPVVTAAAPEPAVPDMWSQAMREAGVA